MSTTKARESLKRDDLRALARQATKRDQLPLDSEDLTAPEVAILLHELGVYQAELKAQNEELQDSFEALQVAKEGETLALVEAKSALDRYQDLYDFAPVGYFTLDGRGRVKEANRACCTLLDISRSVLMGSRPTPFNSFIHPDSVSGFNEHVASVCSHFKTRSCEVGMVSSSGRLFQARLESSPLFMDGEVCCRNAMMDITELKGLQESLRETRDKEAAANQAKSIFLANMSHEMRTPLNGIMGMLELMRLEQRDQVRNGYLEDVLRLAEHLTWLLSEVLDLSSIEAGKLVIDAAPFQLPPLVQTIKSVFEDPARGKGLDFDILLDSDLPEWLEGDKGRMRQLLYNLVGNAVKYTSRGRVMLEASSLGRFKNAHRVLFSVSDTGDGIPPERINDMFEPFTQLDGSFARPHQGAGLGLQIVKRLVRGMNGTIAVDSTPDKGTTVHVSIPFGICEKRLGIAEHMALEARTLVEGAPILVVEDEPTSSLITRRLLEREGAKVTLARNGEDALKALSGGSFSCILMDIQMPGMDGVQVADTIRTSADFTEHAHIPIIAVTAHAMAGDRARFLDAGMDEYITKPISKDELFLTLGRVLTR